MQALLRYKFAAFALAAVVFSTSLAASAENLPEQAAVTPEQLAAVCTEEPALNEDAELLEGVDALYGVQGGEIAALVTARGFESDVQLLIGVDAAGAVSGIEVIAQGETPERGGMVLAADYLQQFTGKDSTDGIDALSGATGTSTAVFTCVETALNQYKALNGLDYEATASDEEVLAEALTGFLGEGYTDATPEEPVKLVQAVYSSDAGYGIVVEKPGFDGELPIRLLVCLDTEGTLKQIVVLEQHETLDNGSQALGENYLALYEGGSSFTVFDNMPGTKIDTLSGATESCYSVFQLVNAATMQYSGITGALPEMPLLF